MTVHRGPYRDILKRLERFDPERIVIEEAYNESDEIVRVNTDDQLFEGINARGEKIEPPYTPYTIELKEAKGQPTGRVTLLDTGAFYGGFHTEIVNDKIYIDSRNPKTEKLVDKYGEEILGLTEENMRYLADVIVKPRLVERFKKAIFS